MMRDSSIELIPREGRISMLRSRKLKKDSVLFNDMLGNSMGSFKDGSFSSNDRTAFGEAKGSIDQNVDFFTGKPMIDGLGYNFLYRNYRPELGKWQTKDPLGYPDGWNSFAYCNNGVIMHFDFLGTKSVVIFVSGAGEGTYHSAGQYAMDHYYGAGNYTMFDWTQQSQVEDFINSLAADDSITLIGHSYGGDTAENAAHDVTHAIDTLITLDPVSFWDFSGDKPDSAATWYNVIAEDDRYSWNDFIADMGGQWGEESGATQNFICPTDHNNPLDMLKFLKNNGVIE